MPSLTEFFANLLRPRTIDHKPSSAVNVPLSEVHLVTTGLPTHGLQAQVHETDSNFYPGGNMSTMYRDRYDYDRQTIFAECLRAWRVNPVARRIVKLISMFVVGEGIAVRATTRPPMTISRSGGTIRLNKIGRECVSFCDEATRSGNLFFLCTRDQNTGMLYVRAVPADQVEEIICAENDIFQELAFKPSAQEGGSLAGL